MTRPDIPVTISGDPRKFEGALARMRAATRSTASDLTASFLRFQAAMAGPAAAATAVITGLVAAMKASVVSVAELSRQSRMAGIDVEAFQELKFAAEQNRIGVDTLTDGLKELGLRADEFVQTGAGSAAEAFQRLGYSSEELSEKLKNPKELFIEIIDRLQEFDRAAQLRISDEVFGGSAGERFVELVDKGAEGLREQVKLGNELGLVLSRDVVQAAEEVDKKFNLVAETIRTGIKRYILEAMAGWMIFYNSFQEFEKQTDRNLQKKVDQLMTEKQAIAQQIQEAVDDRKALGEGGAGGILDAQIGDLQERLNKLNAEEDRVISVLQDRSSFNSAAGADPKTSRPTRDLAGDYMREYREELALSNRERKIASELEKILSDASSRGVKLTKEQAEALARQTVARQEQDEAAKKSASASERAATASEEERKRVREVITELENEIAVVWKSDQAKRALEGSRLAGADALKEEREQIIALNEELYQQEEARRRIEDQIEFERDLTRSAIDDMKSALEDGTITWEEMGDVAINVLSRISDKLLDDVLDSIFKVSNATAGGGGSILGALFGGLFGGKSSSLGWAGGGDFDPGYGGARAGGGDVSPGRVYKVNEWEDEFFMPSKHGKVYAPSKLPTDPSSGSGQGGVIRLELSMSPDVEARIMENSTNASVQIVRQNNKDLANYRQNGGTD